MATNSYQGSSIVDFLKSGNQDASFSSRANLAVQQGIVKSASEYKGSAQQNTNLLNKLKTSTPKTPSTVAGGDQVSNFINNSQQEDIARASSSDEPEVRGQKSTGIGSVVDAFKQLTGKESLIPDYRLPDAPSFEQSLQQLRKDYGVDSIESAINDLDAQEEDLRAQLRTSTNEELGKPVALNVIQGRVGEQERNFMERIDFVSRQKQRALNQLQTANDAIENIMTFRKMDYDVAKERYDSEFSQNLQLFNVIQGAAEFEASEENRAMDNARSNLQIIYNSIQDGNMDIASTDAATQVKISKLELQAGLPQGFYKNIQAEKPEAKVLSTTTRNSGGNKYADVLYQNTDGSLTTQSVYIGSTGSGSSGGSTTVSVEPEVSFDEYLTAAESELQQSISNNSSLYTQLREQWEKDYPSTTTREAVGFTNTELKKLEAAGLLGASRQKQLQFLYGEEDESDNPFL